MRLRPALLCLVLISAATRAEVSIADGTRCVESRSLEQRLEREQVRLNDVLDVDVSGTEVNVRLRARRLRDGQLLVRTISLRRGCEGVEQALVTLIREWATQSIPVVDQPVRKSPPPPPPARVKPVVIIEPAPVIDAGVVTLETPVAELETETDAGIVEPIPEVVVIAVDAGTTLIPAPKEPWDVRLSFAGGMSALAGMPVVPSGTALFDLGIGAVGVTLDGSFEGANTLVSSPGSVAVSQQTLGVGARWRFSWDRVSFDFGLGARGFRLAVTPTGFTTNSPANLLSGGPFAAATLWLRLIGPLHAMLRGSAGVRFPLEERLVITGGSTFTLSPFHFNVVVGLAVAWP